MNIYQVSKNKIRVLQLLTTFAKGGPGHVVEALVKNIDRSIFEVTCCSMYPPPQEMEIVLPAELGVKHICLQMKHFFEPSVFLKLNALIRDGNFDIVHTHLLRADWYGRLVARWNRVPIVSTIHSQDRFLNYSDFGPFIGRIVAGITRFTMHFVDNFIAISEGVKEYLISIEGLSENQITLIHNGIEIEQFNPSKNDIPITRKELELPDESFVIGSVSTIKPYKGMDYLIRAVDNVIAIIPNAYFVLVGKGPQEAYLKKLALQLGVEHHVIFLSEVYPITRMMRAMDVFVLPSLIEGLGLVILEAQALKKACIVTDIPGLRETLIKDKTGLVVPPGDENALADAILSLFSDRERRISMGEAGRQHIIDNFSAYQMAKKYEEVYRKVMFNKR